MKARYTVNTGIMRKCGTDSWSNFKTFTCKRAAIRCLKLHPHAQIDVSERHRGRLNRYCWKYWDNGKIITQVKS